MPSTSELLAHVPLFAELEPEDLEGIAAIVHMESFAEGEHIFHIGEPGRSLFIVTEGSVQVHHPDRESHFELAQFGAGEFFGEMALLNDSPRSATARAIGPVETLVLDKVDFRQIVNDKPDVALRILKSMSVRVRNADDLIQGLTNRALRDPLTGLLNRRAFDDRIEEEVARSRRYGESFALVMIDFDDFRRVNEEIGAEEGDRVLIWVGRLLNEHTRGPDVPFRFEGDAFTILCPHTSREAARIVADRLRTLISEARPPIESKVTLRISTGVAACPEDAEDARALFRRAEEALRTEQG